MPPDAPAVFAGLEAGCDCLSERDDASEDIGVLGDSHPPADGLSAGAGHDDTPGRAAAGSTCYHWLSDLPTRSAVCRRIELSWLAPPSRLQLPNRNPLGAVRSVRILMLW